MGGFWELAPTRVVRTASGPVRGVRDGGVWRFLGLPYARPPTGDLRWRPPEAPDGWALPRNAFSHGGIPAQNARCFPGFAYSSNGEDCLYLNVFAPAAADAGSALPVMLWIPGGGLFMGAGNDHDPSLLVERNVVLVTINYRLGTLGFFSHPAINAEDHAAGNYGLMDQQMALGWVRDNIAAFGGDPSNVTIFGESAGGVSVWCHLVSPGSTDLFHRAIVQSGSNRPVTGIGRLTDAEDRGRALVSAAGCTEHSAEALRAIAVTDLLEANAMPEGTFGNGRFEIGVTVDGTVIPGPMHEHFAEGAFNRVPIINGTNRDEFRWFQAMMELSTGRSVDSDRYAEAIARSFGGLPPELVGPRVPHRLHGAIEAEYSLADYSSASVALATAITDAGYATNGNRATNRLIRRFFPDIFAYEFDVADAPVAWPPVSFDYGAAHTQEIQFLFPGYRGGGGSGAALAGAQASLAEAMADYWTTFARLGTPNDGLGRLPVWTPFDEDRDNCMLLTTPGPREIDGFGDRHRCAFWEDLQAPAP